MSLVVLSSAQFQDGADPVEANDPAYFTTSFSEPLSVFPGQSVELVSFSYEKNPQSTQFQLDYPDMLISIPELGTRAYNGCQKSVDNAIAYVPRQHANLVTDKPTDNWSPISFKPGSQAIARDVVPVAFPTNPAGIMAASVDNATRVYVVNTDNINHNVAIYQADGAGTGETILSPGQSIVLQKEATDYMYITPAVAQDPVYATKVSYDNEIITEPVGHFDQYLPPNPVQLAVNVPGRMELNSLTCKISLTTGQLASQFGGFDMTNAAIPIPGGFIKSATVVLRLSAPPSELAA